MLIVRMHLMKSIVVNVPVQLVLFPVELIVYRECLFAMEFNIVPTDQTKIDVR